jgi:hypothetical protein
MTATKMKLERSVEISASTPRGMLEVSDGDAVFEDIAMPPGTVARDILELRLSPSQSNGRSVIFSRIVKRTHKASANNTSAFWSVLLSFGSVEIDDGTRRRNIEISFIVVALLYLGA